MAQVNISTLLSGSSAQRPMTFDLLLDTSGLLPEPLGLLLDKMYDAREINQATVTRGGVVQRVVWPVAIVNKANPYRSGEATAPAIPPPRRNEAMAIKLAPAINPESATMNTNQDNTNAAPDEKPRALQVLEFIEANPGCNTKEINANFAFSFIKPVVYISKHIEAQKVRRTYISKRNAVYHIEAGHDATSIYGLGVKGNHGHRAKAVVIASRDEDKAMLATDAGKELIEKSIAATYEIPAFLRKSEEQQPVEPAPAFKYDADLGFYPTELITSQPTIQDHIDALFMLLPESASIVISRNDAQLEIDIEAEVFGRSVCKSVSMHEVKETLDALHIVTVEMA